MTTEKQNSAPTPAFYRISDLKKIVGMSESTLCRWVRQNRFPKPFRATTDKTGVKLWPVAAVQDWLADPQSWIARQKTKL